MGKPRIRVRYDGKFSAVRKGLKDLNTVCEESHCPNQNECWSSGTATFLILGDRCTRSCRFCNVSSSRNGSAVNREEPKNIAKLVKKWKLKHAVITSVTRDDLPDGGAGQFAKCVREIKKIRPKVGIELLIPDLEKKHLKKIVKEKPHVIAHNIETVRSLQKSVRDRRASFKKSLDVLRDVKSLNQSIYTKSSIMVGMGEAASEIVYAMKELRKAGVDFLTIGQYLSPSKKHYPVKEYLDKKMFSFFETIGMILGFKGVFSGPLVRSSYKAGDLLKTFQPL
jgi:lipoic acid synthetase